MPGEVHSPPYRKWLGGDLANRPRFRGAGWAGLGSAGWLALFSPDSLVMRGLRWADGVGVLVLRFGGKGCGIVWGRVEGLGGGRG